MSDSNFIPAKPPLKPVKPSLLKTAGVFAAAFLLLMTILNYPLIVDAVQYPLTHSEETDNEQLTAQYRALYGYGNQNGQDKVETGAAAPVSTATPVTSAQPASAEETLSISKIGISAPILEVSSVDDATILSALKKGVVLYPGSANPGEGGTTVIIGHSSSLPPWTKYSDVFALLDKLAPGDLININFQGRTYVYAIRSKEHGSVEHILNSNLGGDLILSSCWPVGTDQGRIVVVAN
ncbi:MAG TPA: sortase, partial [Candidatus Paceibacterota bacterium]|nr:sortase [Candidatus Paceibacterota bacterium]